MTLPQIIVDLLTLLFDMAVPAAICTMVLAGIALRQEGGVNFQAGGRLGVRLHSAFTIRHSAVRVNVRSHPWVSIPMLLLIFMLLLPVYSKLHGGKFSK